MTTRVDRRLAGAFPDAILARRFAMLWGLFHATSYSSSCFVLDRRRIRRERFIVCLQAIMRERTLNSSTTAKRSPPEAVRLWRMLDFKVLSRSAPPSKQ
jgi:hypothetical protein